MMGDFCKRCLIPAGVLSAGLVLYALIAFGDGRPAKPPRVDSAPTSRPSGIAYTKARKLGVLAEGAIDESSGLASGRVNPGVFWTHNDSGDQPRLYAFNRAGEALATCTIRGARARDWEDMCSFAAGRKGVLLVGDVGDNGRQRDHCTLYAVKEPRLDATRRGVRLVLPVSQAVRFRYSEGPANCESIGYDPTSQTVLIVTKTGRSPCRVYTMSWPDKSPAKPIVLRPIATLRIPAAVGMDVSPDGRRAVVLTYGPAYEWTRGRGETWAQAFARRGRVLPMPFRRQGESICYGPDGMTLYLTSERRPTPLLELPILKTPASAPAGR